MFSYSLTSDTWARVISSTCPGVCLKLSVVAEGVGDDGEDAKKIGRKDADGQHCISRGYHLVCFPRRARLRVREGSLRLRREGHVSRCGKAVEQKIYSLP